MEHMDWQSILFAVAMTVFIGGSFYVLYREFKKRKDKKANAAGGTIQLQLQAYERLTLFVERVALPNLISRVGNQLGFSARDMQQLLTQNIKQEYEYNITQQIYVSPDAWTSIKNLKDQNMLIVNQITALLPAEATGIDLCKVILEYLMNDKKANMPELVSEVLSFEAKKLL
jgi:hypothetical protein